MTPSLGGASARGGPGRVPDDGRPVPRDDRAVSPLIATVLLTGIVVVAAVGILVFGGSAHDRATDRMETQRVEMAFVELGSRIDSVAASDEGVREIDLAFQHDDEAVFARANTTRVVVTRYDGTERTVVDRSFGSLVYRHGEDQYAYEAGAVWAGTGPTTRMVSAPSLTYRNDTLTLPIVDAGGEERLSSGAVRIQKVETVAPMSDVEVVQGELITVRITSEYYAGWAAFFREWVDPVGVVVYPSAETVVVHLAEPLVDGDFRTGIVAAGDVYATNPSITPSTRVVTQGQFHGDLDCGTGTDEDCVTRVADVGVTPIDAAIEVRAAAARADPNATALTLTGGETLTAGTYRLTGDAYLTDAGDDVTVDLGGGDVTVIAEGNVALKNAEFRVVNASDDAAVRIYMNHTDFAIGNGGGVYVEDGSAARFQVYGTSDTLFAMGQANDHGFTGVVYAPRESPAGGDNDAVEDNDLSNARCGTDFCFGKGSGTVTGAVVGGDVTIEQNTEFRYDPGLALVTPTMDKGGYYPPPITFLHVAVHVVEVTEAD